MLPSRRLRRALFTALIGPSLACSSAGAPTAAPASAQPEAPSASAPEAPAPAEADDAAKEVASREASLACAEAKLDAFREGRGDDGEVLLFEAGRCFHDAGEIGQAIRVLQVMIERYPDGAHRADGLSLLVALARTVEAEGGARGNATGERCYGEIDAATIGGSTDEALDQAALCLYKGLFLGAALALRRELDRRSLSAELRRTNTEDIDRIRDVLVDLRVRRQGWEAALAPREADADSDLLGASGSASSVAERPESPSVDPPAPAPPPTPPTLPLSGEVPFYAKLDDRPIRRLATRASIVDVGAAFAPRSLARLDVVGKPYSLYITVPVFDADPGGSPRRPRVICEDRSARLGLAIDGASLATVTRRETFVSATRQRPAPLSRASLRGR